MDIESQLSSLLLSADRDQRQQGVALAQALGPECPADLALTSAVAALLLRLSPRFTPARRGPVHGETSAHLWGEGRVPLAEVMPLIEALYERMEQHRRGERPEDGYRMGVLQLGGRGMILNAEAMAQLRSRPGELGDLSVSIIVEHPGDPIYYRLESRDHVVRLRGWEFYNS